MSESRAGFSPLLAQRRCDLLSQGVPENDPEVQRLNGQLVEHDAACALLASEVRAELEAKWAAEKRVTEWVDRYYKRDRLTALPGRRERIIADRVNDLTRYGSTLISRHESVTGDPVWIYREERMAEPGGEEGVSL